MTNQRGHRLVAASLVALVASLSLGVKAADAQSQNPSVNTLGFDITLPDSVERSHDRWFKFKSDPGRDGSSISSSFTLTNALNERVEYRLDPVDSQTSNYGGTGGFTPLIPSGQGTPIVDVVNEVGSWISVTNAVVLNAGESVDVPFTIAVPTTARPGVNLGGISIWIPQNSMKPRESADPGEVATPITIVNRRVIGIEVVTPGVLAPQLRVNGVKAAIGASGLALDMSIENLGSDYAVGGGQIQVTQGGFTREFSLDEVIPGDTVPYRIEWTGDAPAGIYDGSIRIAYGNDQIATWTGTFELGEELLSEARARAADAQPTKSGMPVWVWLVTGLVALLLVVVAIVLGRKIILDRLTEDEDNSDDESDDWTDDPLLVGVDPDDRQPVGEGRGRFEDEDIEVKPTLNGASSD